MKSIGPHLQVSDDFVPNMQTAYETDLETGSHERNNAHSKLFNESFPTVVAMAALIEKERDELKRHLKTLVTDLEELGFGTDDPINGGDCVDLMNKHWPDLSALTIT